MAKNSRRPKRRPARTRALKLLSPHHPRRITLEDILKAPRPPVLTDEERARRVTEMARVIVGPCPSSELGHVLACPKCAEDWRLAQLEAEIADELERDAIRQRLLAERQPARPKSRGKLLPEVLAEHLIEIPLGAVHPDGRHFSVNDRRKDLARKGTEISRSQLTKRLNASK
jgi:hypothetical protein